MQDVPGIREDAVLHAKNYIRFDGRTVNADTGLGFISSMDAILAARPHWGFQAFHDEEMEMLVTNPSLAARGRYVLKHGQAALDH
jgi:hypothetical protein